MQSYNHTLWCYMIRQKDMEEKRIATPFGHLTIQHPGSIDAEILAPFRYSECIADDEFIIRLTEAPIRAETDFYRAATFRTGLYIGHHQGKPADITYGLNELSISMPIMDVGSCQKLIWSYGVKFYLSWKSYEHRALHVKATTIADRASGRVTLFVGRGGSGKTTLADTLQSTGLFKVIGNTHAIVKDNWVWAINSWIRSRTPEGEIYLPPRSREIIGDGRIKHVVIVDYHKDSDFVAKELRPNQAIGFLLEYFWATNVYDLQEDLSDLTSTLESAELYSRDVKSIEQLTQARKVYYLRFDVNNPTARSRLLAWFETLAG